MGVAIFFDSGLEKRPTKHLVAGDLRRHDALVASL